MSPFSVWRSSYQHHFTCARTFKGLHRVFLMAHDSSQAAHHKPPGTSWRHRKPVSPAGAPEPFRLLAFDFLERCLAMGIAQPRELGRRT